MRSAGTSDLPACSAVPQPIAPPRTPTSVGDEFNYRLAAVILCLT